MTLPNNTYAQHIGLLICYYITLSFWSAGTLALSMISRNVAGQTKKTVAVAFNFIFWAAGNAIGKNTQTDGILASTNTIKALRSSSQTTDPDTLRLSPPISDATPSLSSSSSASDGT